MTDVEKKAFFKAKMTEQKAIRDVKEVVINKLINGETLSDAEKVTLATIKVERDAAKANRIAQEAKMTEVKAIMEKVKVGATLTTDEQTKLDAFKANFKQGGKKGGEGKRGGMER